MTPDTQLATLRLVWEVETVSGPYTGEAAQFGMSLGVQRQDDVWSEDQPSYRGRSGVVSDTWHNVTTPDYTATVAWKAVMDDTADTLGEITQAELFALMHTYAVTLMEDMPDVCKFSRLLIAPRQQTGKQSKGSSGSAAGTSVATYAAGKGLCTGAGSLPPEVAAAVSLYGVGNRRKSRGRFYVGPLKTAQVTASGVLLDTFLTNLRNDTKTLLQGFLALEVDDTGAAGSDRFIPWVHNPSDDQIVGGNPPTGSPIATIRTDDRPDSQRRRETRYTPAKTVTPIAGW